MGLHDQKIQALREAWERAVGKDRPKDALAALEGLELVEPEEPRWAHRKGEVLRRVGKPKEAEAAFVRAVQRYAAQGFLARAAALAKVIMELNPARTDVLRELDQGPAKKLRDDSRQLPATSAANPRMPQPPRLPSGTMAAARVRVPIAMPPTHHSVPRDEPAAPRDEPAAPRDEPAPPPERPVVIVEAETPPFVAAAPTDEPVTKVLPRLASTPPAKAAHSRTSAWDVEDDEHGTRPTLVAGVRPDRLSVVAAAMGLESAKDVAADEVRFDDVPDVFALEVDVSELEVESTQDSSPEIEVGGFTEGEAPTAVRLTLMSAATLFVDVPKEAMAELVSAAQLIDLTHGAYIYRAGERADGLYVVVEGSVDLLPAGAKNKLVVREGSVFGEDSLLQHAVRNADTRVNGQMLALRIPKDALDGIVQRHASLGAVLFRVLVRRLVTMVLQTSSLFRAFDVPTRKELARLFEVRRAAAGVMIKERGKRSDGLYIPLAGELQTDDGKQKTLIPLGTMFGQTSLVSDSLEERTVRVRTESVVLRMAAGRFVSFAARFPTALAHVAELAKGPQAL